ncbi:MAG: RluA family pseudouridine synthase [Mogibacterium sp.]|nr:RluA family pseudouridine synthase [Mogibacterium sp.]
MSKYEHIVKDEELGMTVNQILRANYKFSVRFKTKMKYQSLVDLNGTPTKGYIKPEVGDIIAVRLPEEMSDFEPEDIPIEIIYEDDDIIIINKQPGIIVHPTKGHPNHTIANALMKYMLESGQSFKIRFANRIDMDTSGIIIVAKNSNAQNELSLQMRKGRVVKNYIALTEGAAAEEHFFVNEPIGRPGEVSIQRTVMSIDEGGKDASSEFELIDYYEYADHKTHSLLLVKLHTGRTHQIRVHLSHIGHPIAGDELYGGSSDLINRQALHAYYIEFDHPHTGERMSFKSPIPGDILQALGMYYK